MASLVASSQPQSSSSFCSLFYCGIFAEATAGLRQQKRSTRTGLTDQRESMRKGRAEEKPRSTDHWETTSQNWNHGAEIRHLDRCWRRRLRIKPNQRGQHSTSHPDPINEEAAGNPGFLKSRIPQSYQQPYSGLILMEILGGICHYPTRIRGYFQVFVLGLLFEVVYPCDAINQHKIAGLKEPNTNALIIICSCHSTPNLPSSAAVFVPATVVSVVCFHQLPPLSTPSFLSP